ncbi:MAG: glycosyltransferase family 4 protein [Alphaproteobacteria bacterium]|nr:glycosyltransferase family 4 protein [Alphaproteobacteria bacterium]
MRRPSILFMNRVYPPVRGATGRVLQELAQSFAQEGWHVTVVTTGKTARKELDGSVRVVRVKGPEKPSNVFAYFWIWVKMLVTALRLKHRHLIVTMSDPPLVVVAGQIVARVKKSRHINWCHDLYPDVMPSLDYKLPGFVMDALHGLSRRAMKSCEKVIVPGRCMARHLSMEDLSPRQVTMIPNWPDLALVSGAGAANTNKVAYPFHPPPDSGVRSYDELLKEGQRFRVLYAGNIGRAHPIDTILDAAEILEREKSDIEFVFVGDGKRFDYIAQQRTERGLDNIRLLPWQPSGRLREMMESGDVHLVSMKEEAAGFLVPSKLYAALAVARPCIFIGPAQCETAKVINDFHLGSVIAPGQAKELAATIRDYRMSCEVWFSAQGGAAHARDVFTPNASFEAWKERAWDAVHDDFKVAS